MELFSYFIGLLIFLVFARLAFSINTIVRNLQAQTKLLALINKRLGTPKDSIVRIIGKSNMPFEEPTKPAS